MRRAGPLIILLASCLANEARAEPLDPARRQQLESLRAEAFADFAAGRYASGIGAMESAHHLAPHPDYLFNIAVAYTKWPGHCEESLRAFERFFAACQPECQSRAIALQRMSEAQTRCSAELLEKTRTVELRTSPPGGTLVVDGHPLAMTAPATLRLAPGSHNIRAALAGGPWRELDVEVGPFGPRAVELSLAQTPERPRLLLPKPGPELRLDGDPIVAPLPSSIALAPGRHRLMLAEPQAATQIDFAIADGESLELAIGEPRGATASRSVSGETLLTAIPRAAAPARPWPWISAGVAIAGAVVGVVFLAETLGDLDREKVAEAAPFATRGEVASLQTLTTRHAVIANVGGAIALLGAVGSVWAFLDGSSGEAPR